MVQKLHVGHLRNGNRRPAQLQGEVGAEDTSQGQVLPPHLVSRVRRILIGGKWGQRRSIACQLVLIPDLLPRVYTQIALHSWAGQPLHHPPGLNSIGMVVIPWAIIPSVPCRLQRRVPHQDNQLRRAQPTRTECPPGLHPLMNEMEELAAVVGDSCRGSTARFSKHKLRCLSRVETTAPIITTPCAGIISRGRRSEILMLKS
jgi:hypothetical protein